MTDSLEELIVSSAARPGALLVIAEQLMDRYAIIPPSALPLMQKQLDITETELNSVLSFYRYPIGDSAIKCRVEFCQAVTCHLNAAHDILKHLMTTFDVRPDEVSTDGRLLIATVNCLSACDQAPAMTVNDVLHTRLTPKEAEKIVREALA